MKIKPILFAAIAAAAVATIVIIARSTHAAAPDTTASDASAGTNSTDEMAALFGDPVIASGKGVEVKRSAIDKVVTSIKAAAAQNNETITPERLMLYEAQQLEQMIDLQLLLQQATAADKAAGAQKAEEAIAALLKEIGSQDELDMRLTAAGTTEAQLRSRMTDEGTAMAALRRELNINVTTADVQKYYDDHPQKFEMPEMVQVRHILLMTVDPTTGEPLSDDAVQEKRKQADGILARARAGEDFAKLAEAYSDDPATKLKGGEMPPFPRTTDEQRRTLPPEFEAAAFSLATNQISDVVETRFGFDIIQLMAKIPAKKLALTDKIPSGDVTVADAVKDALEQEKTAELAPAYLDQLNKAADVKILDPDLSAAVAEVKALSATNAAAATATSGGEAAPSAPTN